MYSDIGQKSNTMIFSDRPADINALLSQAATVIRSTAFNDVNKDQSTSNSYKEQQSTASTTDQSTMVSDQK
jgi:hypothetical protein